MADPDCDRPQRMIILVGVDSDECDAGYGVMREDSFEDWMNEPEGSERPEDRFGLLYGGDDCCDTFDNFAAAMAHIKECEGELVNVHAAISY